jgi:hypothetical protein
MGSSIGCGPCLIKRRSLVRIPHPPSCVDMSKFKFLKFFIINNNLTQIKNKRKKDEEKGEKFKFLIPL